MRRNRHFTFMFCHSQRPSKCLCSRTIQLIDFRVEYYLDVTKLAKLQCIFCGFQPLKIARQNDLLFFALSFTFAFLNLLWRCRRHFQPSDFTKWTISISDKYVFSIVLRIETPRSLHGLRRFLVVFCVILH